MEAQAGKVNGAGVEAGAALAATSIRPLLLTPRWVNLSPMDLLSPAAMATARRNLSQRIERLLQITDAAPWQLDQLLRAIDAMEDALNTIPQDEALHVR